MILTKSGLTQFGRSTLIIVSKLINVLFIGFGIGLIGYGTWLIYQPAAFIIVGLFLFVLGLPEKVKTK